ncbi:hypothetical protein ACFL3Z_02095 [Gemmatimonadota bacterium]
MAEAFGLERIGNLPTTAQEVIDRYLDAVGGRIAFDTIQTMVLRSTHHGVGGHMGSQVRYYKKPLSYRWEQSDAPVALATDGRQFWWVGPEGWEKIEDGAPFMSSVSMDNHFVDPQAAGIVHELVGVAAFDGHAGFEIRRIWPHGREDILFFSAESGLLTLMRYPHPLGGEYWASYWDYRNLGGVSIPFAHITNIDFVPPHGSVLREIEINVPLPDSLFMPLGVGTPSLPAPSNR